MTPSEADPERVQAAFSAVDSLWAVAAGLEEIEQLEMALDVVASTFLELGIVERIPGWKTPSLDEVLDAFATAGLMKADLAEWAAELTTAVAESLYYDDVDLSLPEASEYAEELCTALHEYLGSLPERADGQTPGHSK